MDQFLLEDGTDLALEDGSALLLEDSGAAQDPVFPPAMSVP